MTAVSELVSSVDQEQMSDRMMPLYVDCVTLVERLHRRLLDIMKDELDRQSRVDINSVQALLLYNIGDLEISASELRERGYYLGSNVSYNLAKLVKMSFLDHSSPCIDRRLIRLRLTDKGREVRDIIKALYEKHMGAVEQTGGISSDELATLNKTLQHLQRFWADQVLYRL